MPKTEDVMIRGGVKERPLSDNQRESENEKGKGVAKTVELKAHMRELRAKQKSTTMNNDSPNK